MTELPFRFAAQAVPEDADQWLAMARHAEALGYSTLLMPDGIRLPSPLPARRGSYHHAAGRDLGTCQPAARGGPESRALAAAKADIVTLAVGPFADREEVAGLVAGVREAAGRRGDDLEFAAPIFVVCDEAPPWLLRFLGTDMATLVARDSLMILRGTPAQMADELRRRRDVLGISYFSVNGAFIEQFAPVAELLAGR